LALFTLATSVFGTLVTVFFNWLQTQLEAAREAAGRAEEAAKETARRAEEAAKKAEEGTRSLMDLIRNEHRGSIRDSRLSNYFVVLVSAFTSGVSVLNSLASGLQLRP